MLVQAQALDNRSADLFVLDGMVVEAGEEHLQRALRAAADVQRMGSADRYDVAKLSENDSMISAVVTTTELDQIGRPAPLVATFAKVDLDRLGAASLVESIHASAEIIGRSFDAARLQRDLESWLSRPPTVLSRLGRLVKTPFRW